MDIKEQVARELASMDNCPFDDLKEKTTTLFDGATQSHYLRRADQILALSGTTDIECPECKGSGGYFPKDRVKQPTNVDCPKCKGKGFFKHEWKIAVVLENGELPPVQPYHKARSTQQDMLDAGYVQGVRQVVE